MIDRIRVVGWAVGVVLVLALAGSAVAQDGADQPPEQEVPITEGLEDVVPGTDDGGLSDMVPDAAEPVVDQASQVWTTAKRIWQTTLFSSGDADIKLSQIIIALLIVVLGLWLVKRLTRFIGRRLARTGKISEAVADTLTKLIFYVAAAIVILIAMQVAGIPTTIFTVLGGALAVGVGFGAQNLFNNLISGVILLTEKPIRKRDIVVIDGMEGEVAEIGNRCTRIKLGNGIDVMVPNSTFLQSNVINWTLNDSRIRAEVSVGVAYGSPVKQVRELLMKVADEHERAEKHPKPIVLFSDFGDNALGFKLLFWAKITSPTDRAILESDIRFLIDEDFAKAGISIAFPQRDVHLDTLRPLEVRMVTSGEAGG